ncbi:hypothetical protein LTR85_007121 [Meristemomyces frigidus]|nr:hypothetical protein LTR85_007121 [Meristemomyces frigidus]
MPSSQPLPGNGVGTRTGATEVLPHNTLMGLPDELLAKVVGYALTSDEAINLYPETTEQDLSQMRKKLLAPFIGTPRLLAIAESEYSEAELIYRTSIRTLYVDEGRKAEAYNPDTAIDGDEDEASDLEALGVNSDYGRELWFGPQHTPATLTKKAKQVRHLELLMPLEVTGGQLDEVGNAVRCNTNSTAYHFSQLGKAFPELRSVVVRITTYRIGAQMRTYSAWAPEAWAAEDGTWFADERPELQAQEFRYRITSIIESLDRLNPVRIKVKAVVLFQRQTRDWHQWRDGPLNDPDVDFGRMTELDRRDMDGYVRRMMDLPSCQVTLWKIAGEGRRLPIVRRQGADLM